MHVSKLEMKLDREKTYAIALSGGGAKGGYEIGVWMALNEFKIKYNAVSGTSVGALNGALMAMRNFPRAVDVWDDIRLSDVINADDVDESVLQRMLSGDLDLQDIRGFIPEAKELIGNKGLDAAPLRAWVREVVDASQIRSSDVELFATTVSISDRRGMSIRLNDLPEDEIYDMLLASAYHPAFRMERLGDKYYADGGFVDQFPISPLLKAGYRDIIAIHIPGAGHQKRFRVPPDAVIHYVEPREDLGNVLNFDAAQAKLDMKIGYFDGLRLLFGLEGRHYYIARTISDADALQLLIRHFSGEESDLRKICEKKIPRLALSLGAKGGYGDILLALLEQLAEKKKYSKYLVRTDAEMVRMLMHTEVKK